MVDAWERGSGGGPTISVVVRKKGDGGFNEDSVGENTNGWAHALEEEWVGMLIIWMKEGKDQRKPLPFLALVTRC